MITPTTQHLVSGLRSGASPIRQWLFEAGPLEIDLQAIAAGPEKQRLLGQVLSSTGAEPHLPIHLDHDPRGQMAVTDRQGEFELGPLPRGNVTLVVEWDTAAYRLELETEGAESEEEN